MGLVKVPPGNATGIFYILVCSLPWNCSGQRLKDFARNQQPDGSCIEIDHAHVYEDGTTSGWVRVKGKENFDQAMAHLTTGIFDHRSLVVDGRNETKVTPIKADGFPGCGGTHRSRNNSSSSCGTVPSPTTGFYSRRNSSSVSTYSGSEGYAQPYAGSTAPISPTSPSVSYYQQLPQLYETYKSSQNYPSVDYFQASAPTGAISADNAVATTAVHVTPVQAAITYTYQAPAQYAEAPPAPSATIMTEARKIIITQLPNLTSYHDLEKLLFKYITRGMPRSSADSPESQLEELNIKTHADRKSPRGHAFAILRSEQIAKAVVKSIDGLSYHGRILNARLAKEVMKTSMSFDSPLMSPPSGHQYQTYPETQSASPPRESTVEYASSTLSASRNDGKGSRKLKEGERERKKKSTSPVVVDGSSGGLSRDRDRDGKGKKYRS